MADMIITELRRTGAGSEPTQVVFPWNSATHTAGQGSLILSMTVATKRVVPAGSDLPVEQVLGVSWDPFDIQGEWSDRWAGRGFASRTEVEFARMVGRTPLVRLQIDQQSIVGLITNFTITYRTADQIGWKFTLSPHRNERVGEFRQSANVVPPKPINVRVDEMAQVFLDLTDLAEGASKLPVSGFEIEESVSQLAELGDAVERARAAADTGIGQEATSKLLTMAATFRRVRGAAENIFLDIGRRRSDVALAFDDAISILKFEEWSRSTLNQAAKTIGVSRLAEFDMRSKAERRPQAIHIARQGESLERIALRYTGNADNWRSIYDANNLGSLVLDGGEELIIPARAS